MRLIDADLLIEHNKNSIYDTADLEEMVKYEPTSYDVDKVIEQLEAKKADCERLIMDETHDVLDKIQTETAEAFAMAYEEAIDIVKAGGENEL